MSQTTVNRKQATVWELWEYSECLVKSKLVTVEKIFTSLLWLLSQYLTTDKVESKHSFPIISTYLI